MKAIYGCDWSNLPHDLSHGQEPDRSQRASPHDRSWLERTAACPNRTDDGISCWQPSLLHFASELSIEVVTLNTLQEMDNLIFLSLKFNRIVGSAVFKSKRLYNIHFSALPAYKEMYISALPILHGAHLSGDMLHEIDPWIDTAPIIDQAISDLPETWTARDLASQVLSLPMGPQLNLDQVQDIINALKNA